MKLDDCIDRLQALAVNLGLDHYPVHFELVPQNFMLEIAVYGMPVRMRHWSFGLRYIHQLLHQHMGHSRIFEVMFPGDPCHAYLMDRNSLAENVLVAAHVIGHADFVKRNGLFARSMRLAGGHILEQSAARAHRLERALLRHGQQAVETVLDAALALEPHIDIQQPLHRPPYPDPRPGNARAPGHFERRYRALPGGSTPIAAPVCAARRPLPPHPEYDLLWFIAQHGPDLQDWERDILLAVREEAFYFFPVHACQIMNEGWASYWHARLLREADFLPPALYVQTLRTHSDVVRPYGNQQQMALDINPYHLGFSIWEDIIGRAGIDAARQICAEEDDAGFIRNHLSPALAEQLDLFSYQERSDGETRVLSRDIHAVREAILAPRYNYGAPCIAVESVQDDFRLVLRHDHARDGRGLDLNLAEQVMQYVARIWRRPVSLLTVDFRGLPRTVDVSSADVVRTSAAPA